MSLSVFPFFATEDQGVVEIQPLSARRRSREIVSRSRFDADDKQPTQLAGRLKPCQFQVAANAP